MTKERVADFWEEGRYHLALMEPNDRGVCLWGILDRRNGGTWVEGEVDEQGTTAPRGYALAESAEAWISRTRHMTEGAPNVAGR